MTFNFDLLAEYLEDLPIKHQAAFAASCAERLLPNYKKFSESEGWGDYGLLRQALDGIWLHLAQNANLNLKDLIKKCDKVIPDTEDFETIYVSFALDAGNAIVETLLFIQDNEMSRIVDIASFCRDTVDMYIQELDNMDYSDPSFEQKIASHPLMLKELSKQSEDLVLLRNKVTLDEHTLLLMQQSVRGKSCIE